MFHRKSPGIWISPLLGSIPWLEHGFGSRHADGWPGEYEGVRQIHSATVHVPSGTSGGHWPEGDALTTREPGQWIGVRTADCVPLLFADTENRAVAAVHAGWRGTLADIARATLRTMQETWGTKPEHVVAAIGPCIGECCFEVGPEVAEQFSQQFGHETLPSYIDLVEANLKQLLAAGLSPERLDAADLCTMCEEEDFHSWRRDREASGRMVSAIRVTKEN